MGDEEPVGTAALVGEVSTKRKRDLTTRTSSCSSALHPLRRTLSALIAPAFWSLQ